MKKNILFIVTHILLLFSLSAASKQPNKPDSAAFIVNHKTSHYFTIDPFIFPKEIEPPSKIPPLSKLLDSVGAIISIDSHIISSALNIMPAFAEPEFTLPKLFDVLSEIKRESLNNVTVILNAGKQVSVNADELVLSQVINNNVSEIYSQKIKKISEDLPSLFSLQKGIFKFFLKNGNQIIASSAEFSLKNNEERIISLNLRETRNIKIQLFCNDGKSPLNESAVSLKLKTGQIIENGITDKTGKIFWGQTKKEFIKLPVSENQSEYYALEIINQRQIIKTEGIDITPAFKDFSVLAIKTDQFPKEYYLDKKITLRGKIISGYFSGKIPAAYMRILFYEQEVGFIDLYSTDAQFVKIGECISFSDGSFELKDIEVADGPAQSSRDIIIAVELSSDYAVMYNGMLGTKVIYKLKIDTQENIWPYKNEYDFGTLNITDLNHDNTLKLFSIIQNQLIHFRKQNPIYERHVSIAYPATKIYMNMKEDIKYFYADNILKITKKGGEYILKFGLTQDNISDLLREASSSGLKK